MNKIEVDLKDLSDESLEAILREHEDSLETIKVEMEKRKEERTHPYLWEPKKDVDYYYVSLGGKIQEATNLAPNKGTQHMKSGLAFRTREEATEFAEALAARRFLLKEAALAWQEEWRLDEMGVWDGEVLHFGFYVKRDKVLISCWCECHHTLQLPTRKDAERLLDAYPKEVALYLKHFGG